MAIDPDQLEAVREALDVADSVNAHAVHVATDGDALVLVGRVATYEEASAALTIAEQRADAVRSELRVDVNLREGEGDVAGAAANPADEPDTLVGDMQESLTENEPWDPPEEAIEVPTRAEARGIGDRSGLDGDDVPVGEDAKSLPDLTPEELRRAAHPEPRDEETA